MLEYDIIDRFVGFFLYWNRIREHFDDRKCMKWVASS